MVLVSNFSNTRRKIRKQNFLVYATLNPTLIIPLRPDSSLAAHVHESLGTVRQEASKLPERRPNAQRQELIATPAASVQGPLFSQEL